MTQQGIHSIETYYKLAVRCLWKRRWLGVSVAWISAAALGVLALVIPNRYEASAQIYVDTQTVLKPLMQDLAFTPDIDQQVKMLARTLVSRPNVSRLLESNDWAVEFSKDPVDRDKVVARLMDQIRVAPVGTLNLYTISYRDQNQHRARKVVQGTLDLFVSAGAAGKRRDSEEAGQFIDEQIKVYEQKLVESENRLKEFKVRNFGVSGVANQDFFSRMSVLSEEVSKLRLELSAAEKARDAYRRELASEAPQLPPEAGAPRPPGLLADTDARLDAQRKQLDELLRRYTEEHPDVASTRRIIAQLETQKRQLVEQLAAQGEAGKNAAATNPVYQKIRVSLAETEAQVASLRSQLSIKEARLAETRSAAGKVPQVEAELAQLNRDYDTISKKYQTLVSRRESASLGLKLDESSRLADFRVVEPPRVAPAPVFPARHHIAAGAVLLSILLGLAAPLLVESIFPTYADAESLQRATGRRVLGTVTLNMTNEARALLKRQGVHVATAAATLLLLQAGWLGWLIQSAKT